MGLKLAKPRLEIAGVEVYVILLPERAMDPSFTPNEEDFELSLTPNPKHAERIARSMRVVSYEEAKGGVSHYIEQPLHETGELTSWDLSFAEYIEEHKNSKLIFCWYAKGVGVVFSPADHHGIWAAQREGSHAKGIVPDHLVTFLEGLAKRQGLV
jgi:hypothetical protein